MQPGIYQFTWKWFKT